MIVKRHRKRRVRVFEKVALLVCMNVVVVEDVVWEVVAFGKWLWLGGGDYGCTAGSCDLGTFGGRDCCKGVMTMVVWEVVVVGRYLLWLCGRWLCWCRL